MQGNYRMGHSNIARTIAGTLSAKNKAHRAPIIKENQRKEKEASRASSLADAQKRYQSHEHEKRKTITYTAKQDITKYDGKAKIALAYKQQLSAMRTSNRSAQLKGRTNAPKNDTEVKKKRTVDVPHKRVAKGNKI